MEMRRFACGVSKLPKFKVEFINASGQQYGSRAPSLSLALNETGAQGGR
jgi:hypothetical protein